jgi:peroxiredoxin Q/BCP
MVKLKEGQQAPSFELTAHNGRTVSLTEFLGDKNIVLFFYPKDDTPGCTIEACGLRDARPEILKYDTKILASAPTT